MCNYIYIYFSNYNCKKYEMGIKLKCPILWAYIGCVICFGKSLV